MCQVENCEKKVRCKGLCQYHYHKNKYKEYKTPTGLRKITETSHQRTIEANREFNDGLWEFVKKELRIKC